MSILFIDDDTDDTELFCLAVNHLLSLDLIESRRNVKYLTIDDGCKANIMLQSLEELPTYIFLDINMPIMGGRECLKLLKANPAYANIPVIIFSTSFSESDAREFKELGAVDCIRKPSDFNSLVKILSRYVYRELANVSTKDIYVN